MRPNKEVFWIGAKGGLLEEKHRAAMRESVWLFLYLLLRQTHINQAGEGVVRYGNPVSRTAIAEDTGWSDRRIKRWTARLVATNYIRTVRLGNDGLIFFIKKAKSKAKIRPEAHAPQAHGNAQVGPQMHRPLCQGGPEMDRRSGQKCTDLFKEVFAYQSDAPIPTSSNTKHPSYYNTTPLADARCSLPSLIRETAQTKPPPRAKTEQEVDETRRLLLKQGEQIKRKYGAVQ